VSPGKKIQKVTVLKRFEKTDEHASFRKLIDFFQRRWVQSQDDFGPGEELSAVLHHLGPRLPVVFVRVSDMGSQTLLDNDLRT